MNNLEKHISKISKSIEEWLQPDNAELKEAIDLTVEKNLFSFEDIKHQVLVLKNCLDKQNLKRWANKSGLKHDSLKGKKILCLHAGNIPLVGIQDLLSIVMTGGEYLGKISKKDPYLLPTLLKKFCDYKLVEKRNLSLELANFKQQKVDAVLFAGSKSSVPKVEGKLNSLAIVTEKTPMLMRTAHFSIAFITDNKPETMEDLTEAVFRYGGNGCRSVAIVVEPFHLNSEKCSFTDYIESFWLKNPQFEKPTESLFYRYAYNKSIKKPQAWLNDFLIEENVSRPNDKFVLFWIKGGIGKLEKVIKKYKQGLQSVYSTTEYIGHEVAGFRIEPLSQAQSPPIWWKPDQVDTIQWLQKEVAGL